MTLKIGEHDIEGRFGCISWWEEFTAERGALTIGVPFTEGAINGLVTDAPCVIGEEESAVAWGYWHHLMDVTAGANRYHVEGGILTLTAPSGERLNFRRVG